MAGPVCKVVAKPRCYQKGHLVRCNTHDVYHNGRSECVQCKDQRLREEREERNSRERVRDGGNQNLADNEKGKKGKKGKKQNKKK